MRVNGMLISLSNHWDILKTRSSFDLHATDVERPVHRKENLLTIYGGVDIRNWCSYLRSQIIGTNLSIFIDQSQILNFNISSALNAWNEILFSSVVLNLLFFDRRKCIISILCNVFCENFSLWFAWISLVNLVWIQLINDFYNLYRKRSLFISIVAGSIVSQWSRDVWKCRFDLRPENASTIFLSTVFRDANSSDT